MNDGYDVRTRLSGITPHKRRRLKSPKSKGDGFERELAAYLNAHLGLSSHRAPLSGGGFSFARGVAPTADLTGTPHLWLEAKRVEKLNFHEAMAQAVKGSAAHNSVDIPVVVSRRNRQTMDTSLVTLQLKDFIKLYASLLKETGHPHAPALSSTQVIVTQQDPTPEKETPCQQSSSQSSSSAPPSTPQPCTQPPLQTSTPSTSPNFLPLL